MSDPKKERKHDLSKYIDDNIRNFDLLASRKRPSIEPKGAVTKATKFNIDAVELPADTAKQNSASGLNVNESEAPIKRSTRMKSDFLKPTEPVKSGSGEEIAYSSILRSKPKRVSFIAAEPEEIVAEEAPVMKQTTVTVEKPQSTVIPTFKVKDPPAVSLPNAVAASAQAVPVTGSVGILSDPARYIELNGRQYIRLNVLGKGGSSCVYRIIGADDGQVYAYKRVEVRDSDDVDAVFDNYANEIALLRRLSSSAQSNTDSNSNSTVRSSSQSRIIELVDFEVRRDKSYIAMVLEAGDIDLAKVLTQKTARNSSSNSGTISVSSTGHSAAMAGGPQPLPQQGLDPFFARMVWREMLEAVHHIHQHRIVHGDLKPANFVFVKGHLKLIDFGIAKSFSSDTTNIYRESQIGTINYMAPEAIAPMTEEDGHHGGDDRQKMRLGRASDVWSLGCILYQMVYGRPPFAALNTIQKLSTIPNPKHVIKYADWAEPDAVDSMKACLVHDPRQRSKIHGPGGLLERPYLCVSTAAKPSCSAGTVAIGKEQMHCLVGAVLDTLSNVAQQAVETAQTSAASRAGVSTRTSRSSARADAEAQAAQRLAQGVVRWIDEVDQEAVEEEVAAVVQEKEGWRVLPAGQLAPEGYTNSSMFAAQQQQNFTTGSSQSSASATLNVTVAQPVQMSTSTSVAAHSNVSSRDSTQPSALPPLPPQATTITATDVMSTTTASPVPQKQRIFDATVLAGTDRNMKPRTSLKAESSEPAGSSIAASIAKESLPPTATVPAPVAAVSNNAPRSWAQPVSIASINSNSSSSAAGIGPPQRGASAAASSVESSPAVKAFNPKPAFLSNILTSSSRLTSFIGAASASTASAGPSAAVTATVVPSTAKRSPLKALPLTLQQQIQHKAAQRLNSEATAGTEPPKDRAAKWIKPAPVEESNLHSSLERQLGALRKLMNWDEDSENVTETVDATGFNFF